MVWKLPCLGGKRENQGGGGRKKRREAVTRRAREAVMGVAEWASLEPARMCFGQG
jgi:hypothetical protein